MLFFRLGDFYELFFDDAETAARVLDITLTTRSKKDEVPIPMCGVPHHAVQSYIAKLLAAGFKVALCDQMEEAGAGKEARGARDRARADAGHGHRGGISRSETAELPGRACTATPGSYAVVWVDLSTGELCARRTRPDAAGCVDLLLLPGAARGPAGPPRRRELRELAAAALPGSMISTVAARRFDAGAGAAWLRAADAAASAPGGRGRRRSAAILWYLRETHRASSITCALRRRSMTAAP